MNVNDKTVLTILNEFIISERLNYSQILQIAELAPISYDITDLKENFNWESS